MLGAACHQLALDLSKIDAGPDQMRLRQTLNLMSKADSQRVLRFVTQLVTSAAEKACIG